MNDDHRTHRTTPRPALRHLLFVLGLAMTMGCRTMEAKIEINASTSKVWRALTELEAYPEWNPYFLKAQGEVRPDTSLKLTMKPEGKDPINFAPLILEVDEGRRLVWRGRLIMPLLFDGTHCFVIEPLPDGRVRFTQRESFKGLLVPFVNYEPFLAGWHKMNQALKRRAESWQAKEAARPPAPPPTNHGR